MHLALAIAALVAATPDGTSTSDRGPSSRYSSSLPSLAPPSSPCGTARSAALANTGPSSATKQVREPIPLLPELHNQTSVPIHSALNIHAVHSNRLDSGKGRRDKCTSTV
jgi:hypothetical protein